MIDKDFLKLKEHDIVVSPQETSVKIDAAFVRQHIETTPKKSEACYVCGKHIDITHWHHCIPLEEIAKYVNYGVLAEVKSIPIVPLCPNCHAYVHKWLKNDFLAVMRANRIEKSITDEEFVKIKEIAKIRDDFIDLVVKKIIEMQGE